MTFGNAAQTNTTATFSAPGIYTLELSADDGVHAVAYDAVVFTVTSTINVSIIAGRDEREPELDGRHGAVRGAGGGRTAGEFLEHCRDNQCAKRVPTHDERDRIFPGAIAIRAGFGSQEPTTAVVSGDIR